MNISVSEVILLALDWQVIQLCNMIGQFQISNPESWYINYTRLRFHFSYSFKDEKRWRGSTKGRSILEYLKCFENGNTQTSKTNKLEAFRNSSKCEKKWTTEKQKHITLGIRNTKKLGKYKKKFKSIDDKKSIWKQEVSNQKTLPKAQRTRGWRLNLT